MGNHNSRDDHVPTGSSLDFYTPPTSPSEADSAAMALPASADSVQTPSPAASITPSSTSAVPDWTQKPSAPSEWAVLNEDSVSSATNSSDAAVKREKAAVDSSLLPSEQSWRERDSGMEPQAAAERDEDAMTLVLLSLMEHYRAPLGLTPNTNVTSGAVEMLRRLITEREELVEEVDTQKETLRTERLEWQQFQCDLQIAVSVADRLRMESEHALGLLQENLRAVEEKLAQALCKQLETERDLESLSAEHKDACCKLNELSVQLQQEREEAAHLRNMCKLKDGQTDKNVDREAPEESRRKEVHEVHEVLEKLETLDEAEAIQDVDDLNGSCDPEEVNESEKLSGKGVAEGYIRSLVALEKRKGEERGPRDPRRIVMLSERSQSLSRLPLPTDSSQNGTSKNTSTLPLCKKEDPMKGRRMDRILQRQDSWSNFYPGNQEDDQNSEFVKPQDGFSALLRRHGGSRRNSLLRWCQNRTQGYKNIEITNFSTCWEDGLAFCAVYHTYLPTQIPYDDLSPADKEQNLDLAFKVGESVGIPAILTAAEMLKADGPDWQRVLGYVESIFRHFEM